MGANNSVAEDDPRRNLEHKEYYSTSTIHRLGYHGVSNAKGKPPPPEGTPSIRNITHKSLTVVWSPPAGQRVESILAYRIELYNIATRKWKVVTSCCQGTSYDVRDLKPDSEYCLRIRAENLHGWSKPSQSTHVIRTRSLPNRRSMFEQEQAKNTKLVRRHSYHIKIEPNVATMLFNRTEESEKCNTIGTIPMRRNGSTRMSLPIQRRTVASLIPGSRRESMCSLKDARRKSIEESSVTTDETDESLKSLKLHRVSMSTEDDSCARSTSSTSMTSILEMNEEMDTFECKNAEDEFTWKQKWVSPTPEVSHDDILKSPYSDDTKIALFSRSPCQKKSNHYDDFTVISNEKSHYENEDSNVWKGREDFSLDNQSISDLRALREMLCSKEVMMKTFDADSNGNYTCNKIYNNVIKEVDEENVMMDIVSTL